MKKLLLLCAGAIIIVLAGCPGPDPGEHNPAVTIESPFDVTVLKDPYSNALILSWKCRTRGMFFEVERVLENGNRTLLTIPPIQVTNYRDISYPPDKALLYRVRSVQGSLVSDFTPTPARVQVNTVDIAVQHAYATRLELKSQIAVRWNPLENQGVNVRYLIRRYDSRENGEETPDVFSKEFVIENPGAVVNGQFEYIDTTVTDHTPYYYSVHWENQSSGTRGKPGAVVLGMSSEYNHHDGEPNDDVDALDISQSCLPLETQKMVIFDYIHPGDMDIDWYNYYGWPCDLKVTVSLENGFNLADNLDFTFVHNNKQYAPQQITAAYPFSNIFVFPREYFTSSTVIEDPFGPGEIGIYRIYHTIDIDGNDEDWEGYPFKPVEKVVAGNTPSETDLSASISFLWDMEALYFFIKVTDSRLSDMATYRHKKDSVQLFLDITHDATFWGVDDFLFLYCWDESFITENDGKSTGVVFNQVTTDTGYTMEVKLPWQLLLEGSGLTISENMVIGLEVVVNDNDCHCNTLDNKLMWNWCCDCYACANRFGDGILTIADGQGEEQEGAVQFRIRPSGNNSTIYGMYTIAVSEN